MLFKLSLDDDSCSIESDGTQYATGYRHATNPKRWVLQTTAGDVSVVFEDSLHRTFRRGSAVLADVQRLFFFGSPA